MPQSNKQDVQMHAVTGAFGYTGKYITQLLLKKKIKVTCLTNSPNRKNSFGEQVRTYPLTFNQADKLIDSLHNVDVLYNTYWVRFNHKSFKHSEAVKNTIKLFEAAKNAGVKKVVHVSITNPSLDSELEYFQGKAVLENELINSGMSYTILRPAVIFGTEDILINNIAWMIRHLPLIGIFGDGGYRLQPIFVEDLAELAVKKAGEKKNEILNAVGPETYTFEELVRKIAHILNYRIRLVHINPGMGYYVLKLLGFFLKDVILTREEIQGLMSDLLYVEGQPLGTKKLSEWMLENRDSLGMKYMNELGRRTNRDDSYLNI